MTAKHSGAMKLWLLNLVGNAALLAIPSISGC
jgi:hypothetical protein